MTSSTEDLYRLLFNHVGVNHERNLNAKKNDKTGSSEYSYESIVEMLKLETEEQQQVEGNVFMTLFGGKRFFSFDNHTIEQLPRRNYSTLHSLI